MCDNRSYRELFTTIPYVKDIGPEDKNSIIIPGIYWIMMSGSHWEYFDGEQWHISIPSFFYNTKF